MDVQSQLGIVAFVFIIGIIVVISQAVNPFLLIIPLIMIGFGIVLINYGFNSQRKKSINDLKRILNGQIKEKNICQHVAKIIARSLIKKPVENPQAL